MAKNELKDGAKVLRVKTRGKGIPSGYLRVKLLYDRGGEVSIVKKVMTRQQYQESKIPHA